MLADGGCSGIQAGQPPPALFCWTPVTRSDSAIVERAVRVLGFTTVPRLLSKIEVAAFTSELGPVTGAVQRSALRLDSVAKLARSARLLDLVRPLVPGEARPVRAIYFDQRAQADSLVTWNQELTLAVREAFEVKGFGPWIIRDGVPHVQAPSQLLEQMLTVRLHLDDCEKRGGAMHVLGGSHKLGRIPIQQIPSLSKSWPEVVCWAETGWALLLRPLVVRCFGNTPGRVLHIDYAGFDLPVPLEWHEQA
jgi:hypothetical protein